MYVLSFTLSTALFFSSFFSILFFSHPCLAYISKQVLLYNHVILHPPQSCSQPENFTSVFQQPQCLVDNQFKYFEIFSWYFRGLYTRRHLIYQSSPALICDRWRSRHTSRHLRGLRPSARRRQDHQALPSRRARPAPAAIQWQDTPTRTALWRMLLPAHVVCRVPQQVVRRTTGPQHAPGNMRPDLAKCWMLLECPLLGMWLPKWVIYCVNLIADKWIFSFSLILPNSRWNQLLWIKLVVVLIFISHLLA